MSCQQKSVTPSFLAEAASKLKHGTAAEKEAAIKVLEAAAATNNKNAMYVLGRHFDKKGCYDMALLWYTLAGEHVPSRYKLALLEFRGRGVKQDKAAAIERLETLAMKHEDAASQSFLGRVYSQRGSEQYCAALAFQYCSMASEQGSISGTIALGDCFKLGRGVAKDDSMALQCYRKASARNCALAMYHLGSLLLKLKKAEGIAWVRKAAEKGHLEACFHLGYCYQVGEFLNQSYDMALLWYRTAAARGHGKSCFQAGKLYEQRNNEAAATHFFKEGAQLDHAPSMNSLGLRYASGRVTGSSDMKEAFHWYEKASSLNDVHGQLNAGVCLLRGLGGPKDEVKEFHLLKRSAAQGSIRAAVQVGNCYMLAQGTEKDAEQALKYYQKAKEAGDVLGIYNYAVTLIREFSTQANLREAEDLLKQQPRHYLSVQALMNMRRQGLTSVPKRKGDIEAEAPQKRQKVFS